MPTFDLKQAARAQGMRRNVALRPIIPTTALQTELQQITAFAYTAWRDAIPRIMQAYSVRIFDGLTNDSSIDLDNAVNQTAAEISRLVLLFTPRMRSWIVKVEKWHRDKWAGVVKTATNVDLSTVLIANRQTETLDTFLRRNVALVKNVSDVTQSKISDIVFRNYQQRIPPRQVAKEIREAIGASRQRSVFIAADQVNKLSSALDTERRLEAGIDKYKYRHSGKRKPRKEHIARNGYIYDESGNSLDGGPFIPANKRAGMEPRCGCKEQAWLDIMEDID